jgi:hypothetical protein
MVYDADDQTVTQDGLCWPSLNERKTISPIHMPRWASRITLEITGIRVERVQEISEEDEIAEGLLYHDGRGVGHSGYRHDHSHGYVYSTAKLAYAVLFDKVNPRGSWESNPWVWVIEFKSVSA